MMGSALMKDAGVFVGSALGGSLAGGIPVMDVALAIQGSLGLTAGYVAGMLAAQGDPESWYPWIGAAAIPLVTGGVVDRALGGMLLGAWMGTYAVSSISKKEK